jgi:TP901 family phage tail tape measure protein
VALENVGLGGVLDFQGQSAITGMKSAGAQAVSFAGQFNAIVNVAKSVGQSVGALAGSLGKLGLATTPATAALGLSISQASDFEKQMSAVKAVSDETGPALASSMSMMEAEAKRLGATTKFTATEAAQGMELLKLSGFSTQATMAAIGPVLSAAAADGIGMAQAAEIVGQTLNSMNMPAERAGDVANILAQASAKSATSIAKLGEAMTYASPTAKSLHIPLEELTALLGVAADAGLDASMGGTSVAMALEKMATPTKEGAALMEELGIKFKMTKEGGLDVIDAFKQVHAKTSGMSNVMEKTSVVSELFGIRGKKAFEAIGTAIEKGKLDEMVTAMYDSAGAAERMAKARLDNFAGAWESLTSVVEGFNLEAGGAFLKVGRESLQQYADIIGNVVAVMQGLNSEAGLSDEVAAKAGPTLVAFAKGVKEGIDTVIEAWRTLREQVSGFISQFVGGQSGEMIQQITKIGTVFFIVAAVVGPIVAALAGLVLFVTSVVVPAFTAVGGIIAAVFAWPILAALGAVTAAFMLFRNDGESVSETFTRLKDNIVAGFHWVVENGIKPMVAGFMWVPSVFGFVWQKVQDFYFKTKTIFTDLIRGIVSAFKELAPFFRVLFTFIGNIIGVVVAGLGLAFTTLLDVVGDIMTTIKNIIVSVVESFVNLIKDIAFGIGNIGAVLGFDWGDKMLNFGREEFHIAAGTGERGMGAKDEDMIAEASLEASTMVVEQKMFDEAALADAVGSAVAENMPKEINVDSKVCIDGKTVAKSTAKHKQEVYERAGFKTTPWQRRAAVEQGASPAGG